MLALPFALSRFKGHIPSPTAVMVLVEFPLNFIKLARRSRSPKATWVEPTFFADVEYRDITSEGLLRQSSFKGLKRK